MAKMNKKKKYLKEKTVKHGGQKQNGSDFIKDEREEQHTNRVV